MEDQEEIESSVQKRGDGARQRVLTLAAELHEEKALTAKLRAASEEGMSSLIAGALGFDHLSPVQR